MPKPSGREEAIFPSWRAFSQAMHTRTKKTLPTMTRVIDRNTIKPGAIYCVGKNYAEHALEMQKIEGGIASSPQAGEGEPIIFLKPPTALETEGRIVMPGMDGRPISSNMHYEAEIVLLVGKSTDGCSIQDAHRHILGFGAGLDMTLRDEQLAAKKAGNPWLKSKGFRKSALISDFVSFTPQQAESDIPKELTISLELNGKLVQQGCVAEMRHSPAMLIHYLSYLYGLRPGDLIFTGTPAGVGRVEPGDTLNVRLLMAGSDGGDMRLLAQLQAEAL